MEKTLTGDCKECESTYLINYDEELVYSNLPEFCPFCGENIDSLTEHADEDEEEFEDDEDQDE
jgi:hypothetical protein